MMSSDPTNNPMADVQAKNPRRRIWHRGWTTFLALATGITLILPACGSEPQKPRVPEFPVYKPTEKFLMVQQRVREWAADIKEKKETEVVLNIIKGRTKFYRAWKPIYGKIEDHKRNPNRPRQ